MSDQLDNPCLVTFDSKNYTNFVRGVKGVNKPSKVCDTAITRVWSVTSLVTKEALLFPLLIQYLLGKAMYTKAALGPPSIFDWHIIVLVVTVT